MNNIKSYVNCKAYLFFIFILLYHKSFTQNFISIGPAISSGSKAFPTNGQRGFGGSIEYVHELSPHGGGVRIFIGYDYFKHRYPESASQDSLIKLESIGFGTNTLLPIRFGYQYFLFKDVSFLYGEVGMSVLHRPTYRHYSDLNKSSFTYALGLGQRFTIDEKEIIQVSMFYNYNKVYKNVNLNYLSLRAAYGLNFNKRKSNVSIK